MTERKLRVSNCLQLIHKRMLCVVAPPESKGRTSLTTSQPQRPQQPAENGRTCWVGFPFINQYAMTMIATEEVVPDPMVKDGASKHVTIWRNGEVIKMKFRFWKKILILRNSWGGWPMNHLWTARTAQQQRFDRTDAWSSDLCLHAFTDVKDFTLLYRLDSR